MGESFSVPIRGWIYQSCRVPTIERWGKKYYSFAADHAARVLAPQLRAEDELVWTGGSIQRCVPGISDLDFSIRRHGLGPDQNFLRQVSQIYQRARRRLIPLGEIHLVPQSLWNLFVQSRPAPVLWYEFQRIWRQGQWEESRLALGPIATASRLSLCLHHYSRAVHYLSRTRGSAQEFYRANYQREIRKTIRYAAPGAILPLSFSYESGLQLAFTALGQLGNEDEIPFTEPRLGFSFDYSGTAAQRFAAELRQRRMERNLRIAWGSALLEATTIPSLMVLREGHELSEKFFQQYVEYIRRSSGDLPIIVPRGLDHLVRWGWAWGSAFDCLDWLHPSEREAREAEWVRHLNRALWERLLLETVSFWGNALVAEPSSRHFVKLEALRDAISRGDSGIYQARLEESDHREWNFKRLDRLFNDLWALAQRTAPPVL